MKQLFPHVRIGMDDEDRCVVVIDDYELFDFIADYLGDECDLPHEFHASTTRPGGEVISMYFPLSIPYAAIEDCLSRLSRTEIERIYGLNN
jgi:hypothetical protein